MSNLGSLIERARRENARNYLLGHAPDLLRNNRQMCCYSFDLIGTSINIDGRFDKVVLDQVVDMLRMRIGEGVVLDVGANIGNHAIAFLEAGRRVFAFEPHPRTFKLLDLNIGDAEGAMAFNLGASDRRATVRAVSPAHNQGASSISERPPIGTETSWMFDVVPLDEVDALRQERIAFVKLDVEGHEREALMGARQLVARDRPVIMLEQNADEIYDGTTASLDLLREWDYRHFYAIDAETPWRTPASLPFVIRRLSRVAESVLFGPVEPRAKVTRVDQLEQRDYAMIVASPDPIAF